MVRNRAMLSPFTKTFFRSIEPAQFQTQTVRKTVSKVGGLLLCIIGAPRTSAAYWNKTDLQQELARRDYPSEFSDVLLQPLIGIRDYELPYPPLRERQ